MKGIATNNFEGKKRQFKMLMLMFKNLISIAKAHCFYSVGACRQPMSKETLNSFTYFADSLLSYLISSTSGQKFDFNSEIDVISRIAFASIQMPFYCHKDSLSSNPLLNFKSPVDSRALTDGVLKPICEALKEVI